MRLFQNCSAYPAYLVRLDRLASQSKTFEERREALLADRYGASHFLKPVLSGDATAFLTIGDDEVMQHLWAKQKGMRRNARLDDILLAQIEDHGTEVFYNLDPLRYSSAFLRRLPGAVRRKIGWCAAPSPGAEFGAYDFIVCNFPSILDTYRKAGWKAAYFAPAHDPKLDRYAQNTQRPIDVLFVGGYTRYHRRRAELLEAVARVGDQFNVVLHLDNSRLTRLAESPVGRLLPLARHRRPRAIRALAMPPVFGRDLYRSLSQAKIVLNGAIDMAGADRGNMRCFESLGCACTLLSDEGDYPDGMIPGQTLLTYRNPADAIEKIKLLLSDTATRRTIGEAGFRMVAEKYSKERQLADFMHLVA